MAAGPEALLSHRENTWGRTSRIGWAIEDEYLWHYVLPEHPKAHRVVGHEKRYDIVCEDEWCRAEKHYQGAVYSWEVKFDVMSDRTGNMALEYEDGGEPSGLAASQSTFWVIADGQFFYAMPTEEWRRYLGGLKRQYLEIVRAYENGRLKRKPYARYRVARGGDNKAIKMVLVKKYKIGSPYLRMLPRK